MPYPSGNFPEAYQKHDYAYWKLNASGIKSALWDDRTGPADRELEANARTILQMYDAHINDSITNKPITNDEYNMAVQVEIAFGFLGPLKAIGNIFGK